MDLTVFLRQLKDFEGVLSLTTNRLMEFDEAILNRIHLKIRYEGLSKEARRDIWECFLSRARTARRPCVIEESDFKRLELMDLDGRDVSIKTILTTCPRLLIFELDQKSYICGPCASHGR